MVTDNEAVQMGLDLCKERFLSSGRIGTYFDLSDVEFIKELPKDKENGNQSKSIFKTQLIDSGVFAEHTGDHLRLTKLGREIKDKHNWNYEIYLESLIPRITRFQWGTLIIACLGVIGTGIGLYINHNKAVELGTMQERIDSIQLQIEQYQNLKDFCHSCGDR